MLGVVLCLLYSFNRPNLPPLSRALLGGPQGEVSLHLSTRLNPTMGVLWIGTDVLPNVTELLFIITGRLDNTFSAYVHAHAHLTHLEKSIENAHWNSA